jgi:hypothetical protein
MAALAGPFFSGALMTLRLPLTFAAALIAIAPMAAEETVDRDMAWKLRREGMERPKVMETLHQLTDVYGPRLTGSPNYKAAADWAVKQLTAWGLKNAHLEPWDFGHPGWTNERVSAFLVSPVTDTLTVEVVAWTPGTNGAVRGEAVQIVLPERPTAQDLDKFFEGVKGTVAGKIVLVGKGTPVPVAFTAPAKRRDDAEVRAQYDPVNPTPPAGGPPPQAGPRADQGPQEGPARLTPNQIAERLDAFLVANRALVRVNDAGREHGQIRAFNNRTFDVAKAVPSVVMRNEDFGRITRLLSGRVPVELEFTIVNRSHPEGRTTYNVVAEIPGTDKRGEVVMLGGHLDSWHSATGATDNAIGCAVMMEAIRLLQVTGAKPRRTVRLALWSAEEQGLLGSKAYVAEHFGTFEQPKAEFGTLVAYFNIDSGTGRARGANVFGPPEAAAVVRAALAPFEDIGVFGAIASKSRRLGGTDSTSFNAAGLPGIGMGQDPIEYFTHTWHTNLDTYERIVPEDAIKSATAIAAAVYHLAAREEMLPRFAKDQMPAPVPETPDAPPTPATPAPATAPAGAAARPSGPSSR